MVSPAIGACCFDAYGTLLDLGSAIRRHAALLGPSAQDFASTWRAKQLEYAWVASLARTHRDFWDCTVAALDFALRSHGLDGALREGLLDTYRSLDAFPDAAATLVELRRYGVRIAVLSNGTPAMLREGFRSNGLDRHLDEIVSIETCRIFKPAPLAYLDALVRSGSTPASTGFVSSNAWDVHGADAAGLRAIWVNRADQPVEYGLDKRVPVVRNLADAARRLLQ